MTLDELFDQIGERHADGRPTLSVERCTVMPSNKRGFIMTAVLDTQSGKRPVGSGLAGFGITVEDATRALSVEVTKPFDPKRTAGRWKAAGAEADCG